MKVTLRLTTPPTRVAREMEGNEEEKPREGGRESEERDRVRR